MIRSNILFASSISLLINIVCGMNSLKVELKQDTFNVQKQCKFCFCAGQKHSSYCNWYLRLNKPERTNWTIPTISFCWHVFCCCHYFGLLPKERKHFLEFCNVTGTKTKIKSMTARLKILHNNFCWFRYDIVNVASSLKWKNRSRHIFINVCFSF